MGTLGGMLSRLPLKPGARPEQALEILAALLIALRNLPGKSAASALVASGRSVEIEGAIHGITSDDTVVVGIDVDLRGISIEVMNDESLRRPEDPLV